MTGLDIPIGVVVFVSVALVVAAVIDGWKLKVPNWLTFPFILSGLVYHTVTHGFAGLIDSVLGLVVGLVLLLIPYAIGGMGAGDVKLFAGVGAWVGWRVTLGAFCVSGVVGGILAVLLIAFRRMISGDPNVISRNWERFMMVWSELMTIRTIRDPNHLAELAAARKPTALLLPYGIPLAIGTVAYFFYLGML
jgi:prepilin peptidase CpaA